MYKTILSALTGVMLLTGCAGKTSGLGVNAGQLAPCPAKPNCVSSQAVNDSHFIEPIRVVATPLAVKDLTLKILKTFDGAQVDVVENDYIRAQFTSKWFRFVDDVEFYFPESESIVTTVHIRSASRVGYTDFGVNRKRIEAIRNQFEPVSSE